MKAWSKFVLPALLVLAVLVSACQSPSTATPTEPPTETEEAKTRVAVLFPGVVYDNSWNQAGYEGLMKAQEECGIEVAYTESVGQEEQEEVFRNYAQEGYDIVIGHGGEFYDAASVVAQEFPDTNFVIINSKHAGGNVSSVVVDYFETWYLAGVLACNMTKSNKVAMVLALDLPHLRDAQQGFRMGAQTCGKEVEVETVFTGSFTDVNKAHEATVALVNAGVDVLIHHMDTADVGMFSAAEDAGAYCIGAYRDQRDVSPCVIASVVGGPVTQMYQAACGMYLDGQVHTLTLATGSELILTDRVPEEVQQKVAEAKEALLRGEIQRPESEE